MGAESTLVAAVLRYLQHKGVYAWRNNTGAYKDAERFIRYGFRGSSDVLGVAPAPDGRIVCVECKTETGRLSAYQREFLAEVQRRGGVAVVVRPSDYTDVIDRALGHQEAQ